MSSNASKRPGADEARVARITHWHAAGHDALDRYGVQRFADGLEYTIEERIDMLARSLQGGNDAQ